MWLSLKRAGLCCCVSLVPYEKAVDKESQADENGDHAGNPQSTYYLRRVLWNSGSHKDPLHENIQENHQNAAEAGGDIWPTQAA